MSDPVAQLKHELLAAADRRHQAGPSGRQPSRRRRSGSRVMFLAAAVSIAAAAALAITAPWSDSVSFLERAQAALTPPEGTILHEKWEMTTISAEPACTVTRGPSELWIDQTPPYRYRTVLRDLAAVDPPLDLDAPPGICSRAVETELGGHASTSSCTAKGCEPTLRYVAPNTLRVSPVGFYVPTDWAEMLRVAIATGRAHEDGATEVGRRPVKRIRFDPPPSCRGCDPGYAYVDPETFYPVELHGPTIDGIRFVVRYLTYEYLPRTEANLALTDIRAQHPNATETGRP